MEVACAMRHRRLTVMPLALRPVLELDGCVGFKLLLPGGEVRANKRSLSGSLTECTFSEIRFDTFIMGVCGIGVEAGVTTHLLTEAVVKHVAPNTSCRVIADVDASKIGKVAFGHVCEIAELDVLVTDASADHLVVDQLMAARADVRRV